MLEGKCAFIPLLIIASYEVRGKENNTPDDQKRDLVSDKQDIYLLLSPLTIQCSLET